MLAKNADERKKEKAGLRKQVLKERNALSAEQRRIWDQRILEHLLAFDRDKPCFTYLCYVNYGSEVSTKEFILWCFKEGKTVFVPKVLADTVMEFYRITAWEDLKAGYQGILEPAAQPENAFFDRILKRKEDRPDDMHFRMLLPGAVFDKTGNRIGYGGGFYDRWLARWKELEKDKGGKLEKIGLAYGMQITDKIPADPYDRKVDFMITDAQCKALFQDPEIKDYLRQRRNGGIYGSGITL